MAFRRSFRRKFKGSRILRASKVARKRYTWTPALVSICEANALNYVKPEEGCGYLAKLVLLDNQDLQAQFSDRVTVIRSVGSIDWLPQLVAQDHGVFPEYPSYINSVWGTANFSMAIGMATRQVAGAGGGAGATQDWHPLTDTSDFTEGKWLKTWQHNWWAADHVIAGATATIQGGYGGICNNVHGTISNVSGGGGTLADGSGTIASVTGGGGTISTTCAGNAISNTFENVYQTWNQTFQYPRSWRMPFNWKKRIPLRESDQLELDVELAEIDTPVGVPVLSDMLFYARIKLLLEIG